MPPNRGSGIELELGPSENPEANLSAPWSQRRCPSFLATLIVSARPQELFRARG